MLGVGYGREARDAIGGRRGLGGGEFLREDLQIEAAQGVRARAPREGDVLGLRQLSRAAQDCT